MKNLIILSALLFIFSDSFSQSASTYQGGINGVLNLQAIANLNTSSAGAVSFDTRYEGVKGTPRLFDTLLNSLMLAKGQEKYIQFKSDLNIADNTLLFSHPRTGVLMEIPSDIVTELVIKKDGMDLIFRTTRNIDFEKATKENRFYQVLREKSPQLIKVPEKLFIAANYKGPYTIDRRYDEYRPEKKYYIEGPDKVFRQLQLNKKSLIKMFPEKKDIINKTFETKGKSDEEIEKLILSFMN